jgi:hypothetical protein
MGIGRDQVRQAFPKQTLSAACWQCESCRSSDPRVRDSRIGRPARADSAPSGAAQSAIAEVARQAKSRALAAVVRGAEIRQKGNRGHRLWTQALAYAPPVSGSEFAPSARLWVAREASARDGAPSAPTRRGLPTSAIRWRRASGGAGVNRRSDRQPRSPLAFPSVAKHKLAPASSECWIVAEGLVRTGTLGSIALEEMRSSRSPSCFHRPCRWVWVIARVPPMSAILAFA